MNVQSHAPNTPTALRLAALALAFSLVLTIELASASPVEAQQGPQVEAVPPGAAPGGPITLTGSGWPAGATLTARVYRDGDTGGPGADLSGAFTVGPDGRFSVAGTVPRTLFGPGSRSNVEVTSGAYTIVVRQGTDRSVATAYVVGAERCFAATGYCVGLDAFWEYFAARGAVDTFGYPVSRPLTLLGCSTQFFQRHVLQRCGTGPVQRLNLLDPDLMPATRINASTFPAHDPTVAAAAPPPSAPNYGQSVLAHLQSTVPDTFQDLPVGFLREFMTTVPVAGGAPALVALVNLELWGFPTSQPARDPNNLNFVYQRFQRGIMHYDHTTRTTGGILLGDWFKSAVTGTDLPPDLATQLQGSRFLRQYCPDQPRWICRPSELPDTDLTEAFASILSGLPAAQDTRPEWVRRLPGEIHYLRDGTLWVYRFAEHRERQVLDGVTDVADFAISPDGSRLALVRGLGLVSEVWIAGADGSGLRRLTQDGRSDAAPVWSSRRELAYVSSTQAAAGGGAPAPDWGAWCAAGEVRVWSGAMDVQSAPPAGVGAAPHTVAAGCDPAWSPDGLRLALATPPSFANQGGVQVPADNAIRLVNRLGENAWAPVELRRYLPASLPRERAGEMLHQPVWTVDGGGVLYTRLVGYAVLCDNSTFERTDSLAGGAALLGWAPDRVAGAAVSSDGRYLALDLARCNAPGFSGYNTVGLEVLDLTRPSTTMAYPIFEPSPAGTVKVAATQVLRERRQHSPAWSPAGAVLAAVAPPEWPGDAPTPDPASPYNGTAPGHVLLSDPAAGRTFRLLQRVDFGSPLAWRP